MVETARRAFAHTAWTGGKFLLVVGAFIAYLAYPPAAWILEINSVHVDNAVAGVPPMMEVDRVIHQNFEGEWTATVMKKGTRGFYTYCTATGANDYRPDAELPDNLNLDWWTWPTTCVLPAGTYKVKTLWVIHLPMFPDKEVRNVSNVFEVR